MEGDAELRSVGFTGIVFISKGCYGNHCRLVTCSTLSWLRKQDVGKCWRTEFKTELGSKLSLAANIYPAGKVRVDA